MSNLVIFNNKTSIRTLSLHLAFRPYIWLSMMFAALLVNCGPAQMVDQPPAHSGAVPEVANAPTTAELQAPASVANNPDPSNEIAAAGPTANSVGDTLPASEFTAEIGQITFATDATDQHEPINANLLFPKGITQMHALFEYSGMSTTYTWERIWYLNDKEVIRKSDIWTGPNSGVFDYFIDNGGRPLPAGDWILEIRVEGKLLTLGAFVIETSEEAQANSQ